MKVKMEVEIEVVRGEEDRGDLEFLQVLVVPEDENSSNIRMTLCVQNRLHGGSKAVTVDGLELYRALTTILRVNGVIT